MKPVTEEQYRAWEETAYRLLRLIRDKRREISVLRARCDELNSTVKRLLGELQDIYREFANHVELEPDVAKFIRLNGVAVEICVASRQTFSVSELPEVIGDEGYAIQ